MLRRSMRLFASRDAATVGAVPKTADVVIVGAGVVGASIALHLRRRGVARTVAVLDTNSGPGEGSTCYSSGCIRTFYSVEDMVRTSQEAVALWRNWADYVELSPAAHAMPKYRECGGVILRTPNSAEFLDGYVACAKRNGIPTEEWDRQLVQQRLGPSGLNWDLENVFQPRRFDDPDFDLPTEGASVAGAVFIPQTGYVSDPRLATETIAAAATNAGATFCYKAGVKRILKQPAGAAGGGPRVGGVELFDGRRIDSPIVVNCAGPFSNFVNQLAFCDQAPPDDSKIHTRALRAEVAFVPAPPGVDIDALGVVGADFDCGVYFRPEIGNRWLVGSLDPPCDPHVYIDDAEELAGISSTAFSDMWEHNVMRAALRFKGLPIPSARKAQGIVAAYDVTPDWSPVLDRSSIPGYYFATGTSGNAFKNAPIIGDFMAQLVQYVEGGGDQDAAPLQVKLPHTGTTFESASTSRLRTPHVTTNTVVG